MNETKRESKGAGYIGLVWRQFRKNKLALAGLVVIAFLFLVAVLAPLIANDKPLFAQKDGHWFFPIFIHYSKLSGVDYQDWAEEPEARVVFPPIRYTPSQYNLDDFLQSPNRKHPFGTDDRGRDVLVRMIYGTRVSLAVGFVAVGIALSIGLVVGALAGYYGGKVDFLVMRIIEIVMCFPVFFLVLAIIAFLGPSLFNIMLVIGITGWTGIARLIRGEFLRVRTQDFVTAARALGVKNSIIMFRHILPNAIAPALVSATFGVAGAILTESALSFLGFGVQPPTPSWGEILNMGKDYIETAQWLTYFPGLAIFITVTAYNIVGESLRDAIDPRLH